MKNKLGLTLFLAFVAACGGPELSEDDQLIDHEQAEELELATVEQELSAPSSPTGGFGISSAGTRNLCNTTSSGQSCFVNGGGNKSIPYCLSGFTTSNRADVKSGITAVDGQIGWSFTDMGDCAVGNTLLNSELFLQAASNIGNGPSSDALSAYMSTSVTGTVGTLTESVPGTWQSFTKLGVAVDVADINARSFTIFKHVGAHSAALITGLGSRTGGVTSWTNRTVGSAGPGTSPALTNGEVCKANAYSTSSTGTWAYSSTCPTD
jgi:hypothetical protein